MKLKLKPNTVNPPLDRYGVPCPNAFVTETGYSRDPRNKIINVEYAGYRTEQEAIDNKEPIFQGLYQWTKEAKEAIYEPDIPATYLKEIAEVKDENVEIIQEYVAPIELTPLIKGKLLVPRFGAYDSVTNITDSVDGTQFGEQGAIWIGLHSAWADYEIVG